MKNMQRSVLAIVLVIALIVGCFPGNISYGESSYTYYYKVDSSSGYSNDFTNLLNLFNSSSSSVKEITVLKDTEISIGENRYGSTLPKGSNLIIDKDVKVTIGKGHLSTYGDINNKGTIDLKNSLGCLYYYGTMYGSGLIKKDIEWKTKEGYALDTSELYYGQKVIDAKIQTENIHWDATYASGSVHYVINHSESDKILDAGEYYLDIIVYPDNYYNYNTLSVANAAHMVVNKTTPRLDSINTLNTNIGVPYGDIPLKYSFSNPYNNQKVNGVLKPEDETRLADFIGKKKVKFVFLPEDKKNYNEVELVLDVNTNYTDLRIASEPTARNTAHYGDHLSDVKLIPGRCVNEITDNLVEGIWDWVDSSEILKVGVHTYKAVFIPDSPLYNPVYQDVDVTTNPRVMTSIDWPECDNVITYGDDASELELSFNKNEYGTFEIANPSEQPSVDSPGVDILFRPADTKGYDWSRVSGYDEQTGTITHRISVLVKKRKVTEYPACEASLIMEGDCLSESNVSLQDDAHGSVEWLDDGICVSKNGKYTAVYTPGDKVNYDYSQLSTDDKGNVLVDVYVRALKHADAISNAEYGQKLNTVMLETKEDGLEVEYEDGDILLDSIGKKEVVVIYNYQDLSFKRTIMLDVHEHDYFYPPTQAPTAEPTEAPTQAPTAVPTKAPTQAPTAAPTVVPTQQAPTQVPTVEPTVVPTQAPSLVSTTVPTVAPTQVPTAVPTKNAVANATAEPVVVTKMATTISDISVPTGSMLISKTKITKKIRKPKSIFIKWKKVSGAKYEICYSASKKWKKAKKKTVSKCHIKLKGLKSNKKYYIKVRPWKRIGSDKLYGKWTRKIRI